MNEVFYSVGKNPARHRLELDPGWDWSLTGDDDEVFGPLALAEQALMDFAEDGGRIDVKRPNLVTLYAADSGPPAGHFQVTAACGHVVLAARSESALAVSARRCS